MKWNFNYFVDSKKIQLLIGKNKTSNDATADYAEGVKKMAKYADYLVINVSSPNTPGLRALQNKEQLIQLIDSVQQALQSQDWSQRYKPALLLKIAPDLTMEEKEDIAKVALEKKLDGLIISNTTISRPDFLRSSRKSESGGLSGKPLFELSNQVLGEMYNLTEGKISIIAVGGVSNANEAYQKIRKGASLVQLYTAFSYHGPGLIPRIKRELLELLKRDGFKTIQEAVGVDQRIKKQNSEEIT